MQRDQIHILGGAFGEDPVLGDVGALRGIYRVNAEVAESGLRELEAAVVTAYHKTQAELDANQELQALFYPQFIRRHRDLDRLIASFIETDQSRQEAWQAASEEYMRVQGYHGELIAETVDAIRRVRGFLERMRFLYSS
jgi:hypothetical protein